VNQVLEDKIGYVFKDSSLLRLALTHSSCGVYKSGRHIDNERLEFLGDAVLKLVIAEHLYKTFVNSNEGTLSKLISQLVSGKILAEVASELDIANYLYLGKGEESSGGRKRPRILAGTVEAIIGAIYLDDSLKSAETFILNMLVPKIETILKTPVTDAKTQFQEYVQKDVLGEISYNVIEQSGPSHDPLFKVELVVSGKTYATGEGKSKRMAEQEAARKALAVLEDCKSKK